ncbi:Crp/Fnr family transcriptional regulator [Flavobacterium sp. HSC-61S13]|uniref:Crp/Fnr family transcriptional regulator n=1 Tax=Flavobacterium sp. HSC-61S13 TaxID=2910963 RepID=UPI00209F055B|nr:Crp/Fnr family transcriptional regulator [Flavobacterium sp. HSC-61S13]MCP1996530.1 CRP-like cAMP-binding protein [Flavobacterium sp. HSC-61S13]
MKKQIRDYFEHIHSMSDADWELFSSKLVKQRFSKRAILIDSGQVEDYLSFVEKGSIRIFSSNEEKEHTLGFVFENEFCCAYDSFLTRSPVEYRIETLTAVELWRISYLDLQELYQTTVIGNLLGRHIAEMLFIKKARRERSLLMETAEQRYINLFLEKRQWIKTIPLKFLASYIGVTPQALSRIRKRIS